MDSHMQFAILTKAGSTPKSSCGVRLISDEFDFVKNLVNSEVPDK